jgi:hypothetical protein
MVPLLLIALDNMSHLGKYGQNMAKGRLVLWIVATVPWYALLVTLAFVGFFKAGG